MLYKSLGSSNEFVNFEVALKKGLADDGSLFFPKKIKKLDHRFIQNLENYSAVQSNFKKVARTIYSNPPSHGSDIVKTILSDEFLRKLWIENLDDAKNRIIDMRKSLISNLINENCSRNFDFIADQKGMFSFTGLTENEVAQLKEKFSIYIVKSGRINVAGITSGNVKYIAKAITGVI